MEIKTRETEKILKKGKINSRVRLEFCESESTADTTDVIGSIKERDNDS